MQRAADPSVRALVVELPGDTERVGIDLHNRVESKPTRVDGLDALDVVRARARAVVRPLSMARWRSAMVASSHWKSPVGAACTRSRPTMAGSAGEVAAMVPAAAVSFMKARLSKSKCSRVLLWRSAMRSLLLSLPAPRMLARHIRFRKERSRRTATSPWRDSSPRLCRSTPCPPRPSRSRPSRTVGSLRSRSSSR